MSSNTAHEPEPEPQNLRAEAQRWVRRRRILDTILGIQAADRLMSFAIDMADSTENPWFYWSMLSTGMVVAITPVVLLGIGGPCGADWEQRQVQRYVQHRRGRNQAASRQTPTCWRPTG
jgi:2TM domain